MTTKGKVDVMKLGKRLIWVAVGAACALVATYAPSADAVFTRYHGSKCRLDAKPGDWSLNTTSGHLRMGLVGGVYQAYCALNHNDRFPVSSTMTLQVVLQDGLNLSSQPLCAKTCVAYASTDGGACAADSCVPLNVTTPYTLTPAKTYFSDSSIAPYVHVSQDFGAGGQGTSYLRSIYMAN